MYKKMYKISFLLAISLAFLSIFSCVSSSGSVDTADLPRYDLVKNGFWSTEADPTGTVSPVTANGEPVLVDVDGEKQLAVTWNLQPDKDNGGSIWTWGDLLGSFNEDLTPVDLSGVRTVSITYSCNTPLFLRWILGENKVTEDGAQHRYSVNKTEPGEYKTVDIDPKNFQQPGWRTQRVRLNLASIESFEIMPILPKGGESKLFVKSIDLIGYGTAAPTETETVKKIEAIPETEDAKQPAAAPDKKIILGYFIEWGIYGRAYKTSEIPVKSLTHMNYAFAEVTPEFEIGMLDPWADIQISLPGEDTSLPFLGNFNQMVVMKKTNPNLKTLISIGGWTKSGNFSAMAASGEGRAKFAASCVDFIRTYQFDGIDLDWEYPGVEGMPGTAFDPENDKRNFTLLLKDLRITLDKAGAEDGKTYLLTAATSAGKEKIAHLELDKIARYLNYLAIMTYDFHGGWDNVTNHQSALSYNPDNPAKEEEPELIQSRANIEAVVKMYLDGGFPKNKLILGVPFYGRAWIVKSTKNNGLFQPTKEGKLPVGSWEAGVYDYTDIMKKFPDAKIMWDDKAKAAYVLVKDKSADKDDATLYDVFITFDSTKSIETKCKYVNANGLAGIMFWELSGDRSNELVKTIVDNLK
ncbi:MAG: glycoside hydrolase family 18 protein [Spirochaetales bacterium]|nr:glycoside hydrolase family 18 protein [Spirochaetales bacterium]